MNTIKSDLISRINFLKNTKISHKIYILFAILITGFVILGGTFTVIVNAESEATKLSEATTDLEVLITKTNTHLLEARRNEKDFLLRKNIKYIDKFKNTLATTDLDLNKTDELLVNVNADQNLISLLEKIKKGFKLYEKSFLNVADNFIELGLDEKSGLQGKLRNAVHKAEKQIHQINNPTILSSMLTLRRHEKDFILRENNKYVNKLDKEVTRLLNLIRKEKYSSKVKNIISENIINYQETFHDFVNKTKKSKQDINKYRQVVHDIEPDFIKLVSSIDNIYQSNIISHNESRENLTLLFISSMILISAGILFSIFLFSKGLTTRLFSLQNTINDVSSGNFDARSTLTEKDELGTLATAFNNLLDDRVSNLANAEKENELLNDSVVRLLQAVSVLSQKDLTMKIPVTEDVTGPVADALNLMTGETSKVLNGVQKISEYVAQTSNMVKSQSDNVVAMAETGRQQIEKTANDLNAASLTMDNIADLAQETNITADKTINTSQKAMDIVNATVDGINGIRDTISEAEKRIKRLGERSQEISGVVGLINTIAERTHILALNASMHAASAGEAGRGFAVVADEVQRLAENAREATGQISTLVSNIQIETADTVTTMNNVITQVVEGSKLAEQAGSQMSETQHSTEELVAYVQKIASESLQQAQIAKQLVDRANQISMNSIETSESMLKQSENTTRLVDYSDGLLKAVQVFKLPTVVEPAA